MIKKKRSISEQLRTPKLETQQPKKQKKKNTNDKKTTTVAPSWSSSRDSFLCFVFVDKILEFWMFSKVCIFWISFQSI